MVTKMTADAVGAGMKMVFLSLYQRQSNPASRQPAVTLAPYYYVVPVSVSVLLAADVTRIQQQQPPRDAALV